jgi:two-component system, NarL family, response regulator NreC
VTTILLADDHPLIRRGLKTVLEREPEFKVVAEAGDGREAVRLAIEHKPDIVVMDIAMPHLNGIDATTQILGKTSGTRVIMLSMYSDESYLVRALSVGAKGYLLKDSAEEDLVEAVGAVRAGKPFFSPAIAKTLLEDYMRRLQQQNLTDSYELLTDREREILQLLAEGRSNKEVAQVLSLSPYTVETHRSHIMQKLNLHNTAEIVLYAMRKKIIV